MLFFRFRWGRLLKNKQFIFVNAIHGSTSFKRAQFTARLAFPHALNTKLQMSIMRLEDVQYERCHQFIAERLV